ncbi:MAG: bifunctional riboflavin kinase/FAD synthetase [Clostridia bacterium]|nr:bifunctional riboflavin kinase/FAD synthetase [Clostridia bacterium]
MVVFNSDIKRLPEEYRGGTAALGFFDGVHIGHACLIRTAMDKAKQKGKAAMVYTFDISPKNFGGKSVVSEITPLEIKTEVLSDTGLQAVYIDSFSEQLRGMSGEDFVREVLHEKLGVSHVVVGFNYRFGRKAACGGDELREYCSRFGIGVSQLPPLFAKDNTPVSSTLIRSIIKEGDMETTAKLLGRPFFIKSRVVHGQQIGSAMKIKTINQEFSQNTIIPATGVYITRAVIGEHEYKSITNVGTRPTVNSGSDVRAETHILDFDADIYGKEVRVEFLKYIREEKKFESLDALKAQILKDTNAALDYFKKD